MFILEKNLIIGRLQQERIKAGRALKEIL